MKRLMLGIAIGCSIGLSGCKNGQKGSEGPITENDNPTTQKEVVVEEKVISLIMEPKSDSNVTGTVTFTEKEGKVTMHAQFTGLTPGEHAIHLHESADCSAADGTSTGGHWNPTSQPHGAWGANTGYHRGDIGNFTADANGKGSIHFETDLWCIGCEDPVKNIIGKGVIVHQGADDLTSQPSGAAGARISCTGLIE
ncbi:MAG: hypothetical protein RLZZ241_1183 [Bacteroidota bacterium]